MLILRKNESIRWFCYCSKEYGSYKVIVVEIILSKNNVEAQQVHHGIYYSLLSRSIQKCLVSKKVICLHQRRTISKILWAVIGRLMRMNIEGRYVYKVLL